MNIRKVDDKLFWAVQTLSQQKKWECILHANDFERTKILLKKNDIEILDEYLFIKAFKVALNKKQLTYLSSITQIKFISSLSKASALMDVAKNILGVDECNLTGKGQCVAFIDTGLRQHCDFCLGGNRLEVFKDFVNGKSCCYDDNGHGTFVAGVCSGSGALSAGKYSGVAPKSKIISLKALDGQGEASADKILNAMEWVYDNHKKYNLKVVCMSFGSEPLGLNDPIMSGAESLWQEGITVVAAAGNSGPEYQTIKSPGVSSRIITVGGFNDNRIEGNVEERFFEMAQFSSRGPAFKRFKPDLVAPAVDITSCGKTKAYNLLSGTSVATPMIAGMCLLLLEQNKNLTPNEIKRILLSSCKPICFNRNLEGYGYPNMNRIYRR
ncbi:MAG: S8 family peptidase [Clostridia bacterium]|nr:S8 family peptidase [Clostridia bacterium]